MWLPWGSTKSMLRIHDTSASPFPFSFKDIHNLCSKEPNESSSSSTTVFHRVCIDNSWSRKFDAAVTRQPHLDSSISIPDAENRIVVYFTSLRAVRSTFEDCSSVRSILRGFHVSIDERDLAMDSRFLIELQGILGQRKQTLPPRVFIGGRYIGGAEEIRQLHETGELKKLVNGLPAAEPGTCGVCGGYRFLLCHDCNGSHKLYTEKTGFKDNESFIKWCTTLVGSGLIEVKLGYRAENRKEKNRVQDLYGLQ